MKKFSSYFIVLFLCVPLLFCGSVHSQESVEEAAEQIDSGTQYLIDKINNLESLLETVSGQLGTLTTKMDAVDEELQRLKSENDALGEDIMTLRTVEDNYQEVKAESEALKSVMIEVFNILNEILDHFQAPTEFVERIQALMPVLEAEVEESEKNEESEKEAETDEQE